ncbi:MAG: hypothetical protein ABJ201_03010, partial [Nisaea sp.]
MAYDRQGRKAAVKPEEGAQTATPNAARIQGGKAVKGKAPARRPAGTKSHAEGDRAADHRQAGILR